jgi:hypothetical protein
MAIIRKAITGLKPGSDYLFTLKPKNVEISATDAEQETIRVSIPAFSGTPSIITGLQLASNFQTIIFKFDPINDADLSYFEYQVYDNEFGDGTPINEVTSTSNDPVSISGTNTANVFLVSVDNSTDTQTIQYWGRVRAVNIAGNPSTEWSELVASGELDLISDTFIGSLTAAKITAGTIGAHTIELAGATSIIKSSLFNGTLSGGGTYSGATQGWLINGTGNLYSTTGKIGPVNITSSNMNSQGSSPYLNSNNNYYRFDQFGDMTVFSNPGSDVGGAHEGLFHKTSIVGEYISINRTNSSFANAASYAAIGYMGSTNYPTGTWQVGANDSAIIGANGLAFIKPTYQTFYEHNRAYVTGNITATSLIEGNNVTATSKVSGYNVQASTNLNIGDNPSAGPAYVNSNSIEIQTDTNFGGIYDAHTGYAIYSTMSTGWGNAELFFQCSNNWLSYAYSPVAFKIGQSTVTASGYAYFSDRRLKENIVDCNFGLKEILKLNPKNYNLIQDSLIIPIDESDTVPPPKLRTGLIAQDVLEVIPSIVSGGEGEEYYSLDYNMIIPILINSIKELSSKVDALEARLV